MVPISLLTFHHQGDRQAIYRVPAEIRKLSALRKLYTGVLIDTPQYSLRMLAGDAPAAKPELPAALARYGTYEVFILEIGHAMSFVTRFKAFAEFEEIAARAAFWKALTPAVERIAKEMLSDRLPR